MEPTVINGVPQEFSIRLTQSSKGIFTVESLTVTASSEELLLARIDSLVTEIKERLVRLNNNIQ